MEKQDSMVVFDLYSKRQKRLRGDVPDIYTYETLPKELRIKIVHIWNDVFNDTDHYEAIVEILRREYGVFQLYGASAYRQNEHKRELITYFLVETDVERQLDVVEISFRAMGVFTQESRYKHHGNYIDPNSASELLDNAVNELNERFREHGIGFQFLEDQLIRIDSEFVHVEAVKPALKLLNEGLYQGAQQEFLSAYEHYKQGRNKESITDCLKSFESTMKAICNKREWVYRPNDTAKALIEVCFENQLIPSYWQSQFSSLRNLLESGIPTGRNKTSGRGQGSIPVAVPDYLVTYILHMTASTLLFLASAEKELSQRH